MCDCVCECTCVSPESSSSMPPGSPAATSAWFRPAGPKQEGYTNDTLRRHVDIARQSWNPMGANATVSLTLSFTFDIMDNNQIHNLINMLKVKINFR